MLMALLARIKWMEKVVQVCEARNKGERERERERERETDQRSKLHQHFFDVRIGCVM